MQSPRSPPSFITVYETEAVLGLGSHPEIHVLLLVLTFKLKLLFKTESISALRIWRETFPELLYFICCVWQHGSWKRVVCYW